MNTKERLAHVKLFNLYIATLNGFSKEDIGELREILKLVEESRKRKD